MTRGSLAARHLVHAGTSAADDVPHDGSNHHRNAAELPQGPHHTVVEHSNGLVNLAHGAETLIEEAVERFVDYDEWFSRQVREGLNAAG